MYDAPAPLNKPKPHRAASAIADIDMVVVRLAACAVLVTGRVALTASCTAGLVWAGCSAVGNFVGAEVGCDVGVAALLLLRLSALSRFLAMTGVSGSNGCRC
jgi:hypothetical protein